jgi:hypothetical protein
VRYILSAAMIAVTLTVPFVHHGANYSRPYIDFIGTAHGSYITYCHGLRVTEHGKAYLFNGCLAPRKI